MKIIHIIPNSYYEFDIEVLPRVSLTEGIHHKDIHCYIIITFYYTFKYPDEIPLIILDNSYNLTSDEKLYLKNQLRELFLKFSNKKMEMILDSLYFLQEFIENKNNLLLNTNLKGNSDTKIRKLNLNVENKVCNNQTHEREQNQLYLGKLSSEQDPFRKNTSLNIDLKTDYLEDLYLNSNSGRLKRDFEILKNIGAGGGGMVMKVKNRNDEMVYAIKKVKESKIKTDKNSNKK